jgi:hypothetical protein
VKCDGSGTKSHCWLKTGATCHLSASNYTSTCGNQLSVPCSALPDPTHPGGTYCGCPAPPPGTPPVEAAWFAIAISKADRFRNPTTARLLKERL